MIDDRVHVERGTANAAADHIEQLKTLFPEVVTEGRVDFDRLRATLGGAVDDRPERFSFTWAGKREGITRLQELSRATLVPAPTEGVHPEAARNVFVEGENLDVLKLIHKAYSGRVKCCYIDPPYNTGKDFIYPDNYADPMDYYLRLTRQRDAEGNLLTSNPETSGRFHSAWLTMMYPRLFLARQLLREDGVIFVSIGDREVAHLRLLLNEIFGEENFIATLIWQTSKKGDAKLIADTHQYILAVARNKPALIQRGKWRKKKPGADEVLARYDELRAKVGEDHTAIATAMREWYASLGRKDPRRAHEHYRWSDDRGLYFADNFAGPDDGRDSRPRYDIIHPITRKPCKKPSTGWRWDEERTAAALAEDPPRVHFGPDETTIPNRKSYLREIASEPFASVFYRDGRAGTLELERLVGKGLLEFPKDVDVLKELIELTTGEDDLVLDFFAGTAPTAQAVLSLNRDAGSRRRFIMVQLPYPTERDDYRTIADIGKARIRNVLAEMQPDPATLAATTQLPDEDLGFRVFRMAPSHYKQWADPEAVPYDAYVDQVAMFSDPLVPSWTPEGVLWEVAIKEGYGLTSRVDEVADSPGSHVWRVTDGDKGQSFHICLDDDVSPSLPLALGLGIDDLFVCRDAALDDQTAANLALQCRLRTI